MTPHELGLIHKRLREIQKRCRPRDFDSAIDHVIHEYFVMRSIIEHLIKTPPCQLRSTTTVYRKSVKEPVEWIEVKVPDQRIVFADAEGALAFIDRCCLKESNMKEVTELYGKGKHLEWVYAKEKE